MICPNCYEVTNGKPFNFDPLYIKCDTCGVYFQIDIDDKAEEGYYASGAYRNTNQQADERVFQQRRADHVVKAIHNPSVFIDIGCSLGVLMDTVKAAYPSVTCYGVDIDPVLARNVYKRIEDVPECADVVTMIHSLEHMPHPLAMLRRVFNKMKEGGAIIIEVPNGEATHPEGKFYAGAFKRPHPLMFDTSALAWTMDQAGFVNLLPNIHGEGGLVNAPDYYYLMMIGVKPCRE